VAALTDLGFTAGTISEVILSTYNENKQPNAAPMGTTTQNGNTLIIKPFMTSQTYRNLQSQKCGVINLTCDVDLFYRTAFKETNSQGKLPNEWFTSAQTVNAPKLVQADATVEVAVQKIEPLDSERAQVACKATFIDAQKVLPQAYCRAQFAVIEAIVHATRVKAFLNGTQTQKEHASKLLQKIQMCQDVVEHTAPNSRYGEVMADLMGLIDLWRKAK
jgi:hypothetical protein